MTCRTCGEDKPATEFYIRRGRSKPQTECKVCMNERKRRWSAENQEHERAVQRESKRRFQRENRLAVREAQDRWRFANPEKKRAHNLVFKAVRRGELVKPATCEECGESRRLHGHHDDYSKPLEVRWLCAPCHSAVHSEERAA